MKLDNLINIQKQISNEVSDSFNDIGTKNMKLLVDVYDNLRILIERISEPEKAIKLDKLHDSKIWKD